jgi:Family of unknown function (DUF5675)
MILKRIKFNQYGIFGELLDDANNHLFYTLEHSYDNVPKLPNGTYSCVIGNHRLEGMTEDFQTFEITNVPGHTNILFHWGNYNDDSEGCVLLGMGVNDTMLLNSREAFKEFMQKLQNTLFFQLVVS